MLFTTEPSGRDNLLREGVADKRIHFVGNVMIDTLRHNLARAIPTSKIASDAGRPDFASGEKNYAVVTMHRPANVDDEITLGSLINTVVTISAQLPVIFPLHPRTKSMIEKFGFGKLLDNANILLLPPMGYLEMLGLMKDAKVVLTDSGGIQEETTALGVPCITLRSNTERPITVDEGTNTIAGQDPETIPGIFNDVMRGGGKGGRIPQYWDGRASNRIADLIAAEFGIAKPQVP
ncbi:MAG: UDP-N-acetylglucosamine 2-epimerase, partial [Undibacterium sp.]|nr:UDP-N-acetylglucosamine 2-epimerase [Undibacterium sp.]